ncbi:uncharacterized protein LOC131937399 [Physella acuta]|uniref:uncharacterized protein LOC131937399 n=1 Tax=Physella acuta TaxID=109671 RepID=UPI0027DD942D|nr:uncharacterized protein LOC131937399 [Physella acuta]
MEHVESAENLQTDVMTNSASNDYSKYGITDAPKSTKTTALGKTKTCSGLSRNEWIFLLVSSANILTAIALTLYRMISVIKDDDSQNPDFTFTLLLLINAGFCVYYVLHGVFRERVFEVFAFMGAVVVVAVYCLLEYFVFNTTRQSTVKLVRLILACILAPPNIYLAYIVSRNFGYLQFRSVGASGHLQKLYKQAGIFSCLLKFDLQAACSIVVLALESGTKVSILETASLAVGIPYSLLWCLLGWISMKRELKSAAVVFAVFGLVKPCYYIYKIVQEYIELDEHTQGTESIVYSLIAAVALGLLVWFVLMVELVFVCQNFGQGLRTDAAKPVNNERTGLLGSRTNFPSSTTASL